MNGDVLSHVTNLWCLGVSVVDVSPLFALLSMSLLLAVLMALVLVRMKQSLLVGYLLCGVILANCGGLSGIGGTRSGEIIANLAEIGVILLMFTLGVEFSVTELKYLWRKALLSGGLQMGITTFLAGGIWWFWGHGTWQESVVIGVAVALSSTAVAMKSFHELGVTQTPGARAAFTLLLLQDLLVIGFMLLLPVLYHAKGGSWAGTLGAALGKGVLFLGGALLLGRYGVTNLLHAVARTRSRELFTLSVVALCCGVALVGGLMGLSLALGAFAAGLIVSESIYRHRILTDILPFKDLFLAIFFISVGLQVNLREVWENLAWILGLCAAILVGKGLVVAWVARVLKLPPRGGMLMTAALASTGEFSLVLLQKAGHFRAFSPKVEQCLLVSGAVTMGCVPMLMQLSLRWGPFWERWAKKSRRVVTEDASLAHEAESFGLKDHAVICGYGPVGRALNEALKRCGVKTLVMELNVETVRELKKQGQLVLFADVSHPEAIDLAGIQEARMVAFTFPHTELVAAAAPLMREKNPGILLYGRAKFAADLEILRGLDVFPIHDERESAVAMVREATSVYVSLNEIEPEEMVGDALENGA